MEYGAYKETTACSPAVSFTPSPVPVFPFLDRAFSCLPVCPCPCPCVCPVPRQVMLSPAMQGVILAIAKARQTFDRDGSEAGLVKVPRLCAQPSGLLAQHEGSVPYWHGQNGKGTICVVFLPAHGLSVLQFCFCSLIVTTYLWVLNRFESL